MLQKQKEDWKKKVVVSRTHVLVNTRVSDGHIVDKYKNIREDPLEKKGLGLSSKKLKQLKLRGISAKYDAPNMPVNQNAAHQWISNECDVKP